jgi:cytochrome b
MSQAPSVRIWDHAVRVFHWSLATSILVAWLTSDEWKAAHLWVGYCAAALVAFRIVWGFIGTPYARFRSFLKSPAGIAHYAADIMAGREKRYLGHNPAGGAMILALLATVLLLGLTGWMQTLDLFWGDEWLEESHEFLADGLLVLIAMHVAGVLLASWRHGENLVAGMISGRKRVAEAGDVSIETVQAAE